MNYEKTIQDIVDTLKGIDYQVGENFKVLGSLIQNDAAVRTPPLMSEQYDLLDSLVKNQIEVKDRQIDKLHSELEIYKQDSPQRYIDQFMKSLIKVRKDLARQIHSEHWSTLTADDLRREYTYVFDDLTDLLEQQNIDSYQSDVGTMFNAAIHQAKIEPTNDKSLDKQIKCSLSEGYTKGDKVLIPERVLVYQYKE